MGDEIRNVINKYAEDVSVTNTVLMYHYYKAQIVSVRKYCKDMEVFSTTVMNEQYVLGTSEEGINTYNDKPTSKAELGDLIMEHIPKYNRTITDYIITKMINYAKKDGSASWTYYASQFGG